ncbi:hypothetical protein NE237_000016 [Protea cynaroides]|uniref:Uncharacterized protein n=1 Tax=Protea cynaroides TaxID=273540 RepID=A0A9Q0JRS5_9MAGN|nr:hypothetical protein NE237_000016 [Protea cynaroides]
MQHTLQEYLDTAHSDGKNAKENGSKMAAKSNLEEVEGVEVQNDPPRVDGTRSKEKSLFSLMLRNQSLELDPTRTLDSLDPLRLQPAVCPESGHLSSLEGLSDGPASVSSGLCAQSIPSPILNVFQNPLSPFFPRPLVSNRFKVTEVSDLSLSDTPEFPAGPCFSQLAPNLVSSPEITSAQPSDPLPNPLHSLAQNSSSRDLFSLCGEPVCLESVVTGSSPITPSPGKNFPNPEPSSIGRTPYPSRSCISPCSMLSGHLSF